MFVKEIQEEVMQLVVTAIAVIAGMVFSLAIALLVEEFIFGEVFRMMYLRQARLKVEQKQ
jgi:ABC-type sugar transport system permease subunit